MLSHFQAIGEMTMTTGDSGWIRMRFKQNKVWVAVDLNGNIQIHNGKALIKYQKEQDYEYRSAKQTFSPGRRTRGSLCENHPETQRIPKDYQPIERSARLRGSGLHSNLCGWRIIGKPRSIGNRGSAPLSGARKGNLPKYRFGHQQHCRA